MSRILFKSKWLTGIILVVLTGCASFPGKELPEIKELTDKSHFSQKPSVCLEVKHASGSTGDTQTPVYRPEATEQLKKIVNQVTMSSNFFSQFAFTPCVPDENDYSITMEMLNYGSQGSAAASGFLTGFTLFLIPGAATDHYKLTAKVKGRDGNVIKTYEVKDKLTTWFGIWFIPFMGNTPASVSEKLFGNMVKTIYQQIDQDNLLPYANRFNQNRLIAVGLYE